MLPTEQEILVNELSIDGYQGWSDLYDLVTGRMSITVTENGKEVTLSPGQAANRMSGPDPAVRAHIMERWEEAWAKEADLCALALNRLAGYRLSLYRRRGWDSVLKEPLENNRMTRDTLDAMWDTIDSNKDRLVTYMQKRRSCSASTNRWQDLDAPVGRSDKMKRCRRVRSRAASREPKMVSRHERLKPLISRNRPGKRMEGSAQPHPGIASSSPSRELVTWRRWLMNWDTLMISDE